MINHPLPGRYKIKHKNRHSLYPIILRNRDHHIIIFEYMSINMSHSTYLNLEVIPVCVLHVFKSVVLHKTWNNVVLDQDQAI